MTRTYKHEGGSQREQRAFDSKGTLMLVCGRRRSSSRLTRTGSRSCSYPAELAPRRINGCEVVPGSQWPLIRGHSGSILGYFRIELPAFLGYSAFQVPP